MTLGFAVFKVVIGIKLTILGIKIFELIFLNNVSLRATNENVVKTLLT